MFGFGYIFLKVILVANLFGGLHLEVNYTNDKLTIKLF